MNLLRKTWVILVAIMVSSCHAYDIKSPNRDLKVTIEPAEDNTYGEALFSVDYKGNRILSQSKLGLETDAQKLAGNLKLKSVSDVLNRAEAYDMITGKRKRCVNLAREKTFSFENEKGQTLDVTFRVYNDGIAFKYKVNAVADEEHIINEHTEYTVPQGAKRWMQQYDPGYEKFYPLSTDGKLANRPDVDRWGYPALVEPKDSVFMLITEADIKRGHCGSLLYNGDNRDSYRVRLADDKQAVGKGSWESPWRLLITGDLSDVVESTLVTDVSEPSKVKDTEWITPGMVSWIYWAHNHGSRDYQIIKEYIDLAVRMKWPYDLIDAEWDEMVNGGNIEDVVKYALQQNVKPLIWYNSSTNWINGPGPGFRLNKKEDREKEYKWLQDIGVVGIKVDFFSGDSATTMNYYMDLLEDAVKYKLMVNFHGSTIPRGWQRTYPHMMSMEGVYGAEWYNNAPVLTNRAAEHNATLPFTRNVIGPMDYTPGTFSDSQHPHITSHGHELALPVIFESPLQHMPDRPSTYDNLPEPVKRLLSELPTAWDDTKFLAGYPGVEVIMARRKGDVWYIAGINGTNEPRTLRASLEAIPVSGKQISLFKDGADDKNFAIEENISLSDNETALEVQCLPRGGFVAIIK
ncbi:glycoside hydrolase family 97 protein [Bacteroides sp. UBA939]|uniref:glycoside hydrolase family 97 protein n=1 Tax=Bacteroides sp. UBA939 TaxID=1946092 RepID=UPI0025C0058F|nr:glycoside hydrolase family 97 protein [Bacteroides sp. UBA939]